MSYIVAKTFSYSECVIYDNYLNMKLGNRPKHNTFVSINSVIVSVMQLKLNFDLLKFGSTHTMSNDAKITSSYSICVIGVIYDNYLSLSLSSRLIAQYTTA